MGLLDLRFPFNHPARKIRILHPYNNQGGDLGSLRTQQWVQDESVNIITVYFLFGDLDDYLEFFVIISVEKLLRVLEPLIDTLNASGVQSLPVPWNDWGPKSSQIIPRKAIRGVIAATVSGSRLAFLAPRDTAYLTSSEVTAFSSTYETPEPGHLMILDFNPRPILRAEVGASSHASSSTQVFKDPKTLRGRHFIEDVTCHLPFRMFLSSSPSAYDDIALCGDFIVVSEVCT